MASLTRLGLTATPTRRYGLTAPTSLVASFSITDAADSLTATAILPIVSVGTATDAADSLTATAVSPFNLRGQQLMRLIR